MSDMVIVLKGIGKAAAVVLVGSAVTMAIAAHNASENRTPEQAHQDRVADAEARYMQQAIRRHTVPPDARRAICDTRDRLIGYWTFEYDVVIFDGKDNATTATCW